MSNSREVILSLDTTNPHQRKIAMGIAKYSRERGNWNLHPLPTPNENLPYLVVDPLKNVTDLRRLRADGVIAHCFSRKIAAAIRDLKVPVVEIEPEYGQGQPGHAPYFCSDNEAIGELGAKELIARGFKRLAFSGIPRSKVTAWSTDRQVAFERVARDAGVPCSVFCGGGVGARATRLHKELTAWLVSLEKPVGLMACYDVRAQHILNACWELQLLVPEDVAVIGVSNDELACELSTPPLGSIEQGSRTIGYQAAALLDRMMDGERVEPLRHRMAPEEVVVRRSCDAVAVDDCDVAAALHFIRQHACEGIHVGDVVRAVTVSRSALTARFKTFVKRTIREEIHRVQVERARQLLVSTDLSLHEVAKQSGFQYPQHLISVFRLHTGMTPGQYRVRAQQGVF